MPKKKNRALNIAKKREKRKQDRKKRKKTMLSEKNHSKGFPRFNEERLGEKIFKSSILADEPEFSELTFDTKLALEYSKAAWEKHCSSASSNEEDAELDAEILHDEYRTEIIQELLTEDFTRKLARTLKACATRLTRTGNHSKAELAIITLTMIEFTNGFPLNIHPLIVTIYERTINVVIDEISESEPDETTHELLAFLKTRKRPHNIITSKVIAETKEIIAEEIPEAKEVTQTPDDNAPPAKALYKVLNFEKVKSILAEQKHFHVLVENEAGVDMMNANTQQHLTL